MTDYISSTENKLAIAGIVVAIAIAVVPYLRNKSKNIIKYTVEYIEKKKTSIVRNRLSKKFFKEFENKNYVDKFVMLIKYYEDNYSGHGFGNIIDRLNDHEELKNNRELEMLLNSRNLIKDQFTFWKKRYKLFSKNIEFAGFLIFLEEFSTIVINYYRHCIVKSRNIITRNETRDWQKAMADYDYFRNSYNDFIDDISKKFGLPEGHIPKLPPPIHISITG